MKKLTTTLFLSLALFTACSKGSADNIVKLKDEVCACKDKKCAEEANKKMEAELDKFKSEPDEATMTKLMTAMVEAGECISKLDKEEKAKK